MGTTGDRNKGQGEEGWPTMDGDAFDEEARFGEVSRARDTTVEALELAPLVASPPSRRH